MDGKMFLFIVFFIFCANIGLQYTSATTPGMTLVTDDGETRCARKYTTCSLSVDGLPIMGRGEKGDSGFPGMPGLQGSKGERGENGKRGPAGPPGREGPTGRPGLNGMPGFSGLKGDRGKQGETGPKGSMGLPGPVGPPGIPGMPGVSGCSLPINTAGDVFEPSDDFGTKDMPAEIPCKSAPAGTTSGIYYLGPLFNPMEVYCNMTTQETCIRRNKTTPEFNYSLSKEAFWLSAKNVHMKELYNDTSAEQLTWLRARSNSVRQTLKYNCLDSVPYPKHNVSSSVKLWAWNDLVIGPYPSTESPVFYSVPEATDNCKEGSTEWQSTIIEVQSSNVYRLPMADLWIGDIRNTAQKMSVQSVELCFR